MDNQEKRSFGKVLVTGAAGFAGHYLVRELLENGHEAVCIDAAPADSAAAAGLPGYERVDLTDAAAVDEAVARTRPDAAIHLAAVSFIPDAARDPGALWAVNINGTVNVVEAVLRHCPRCRFVFVSSAQVYGAVHRKDGDGPLGEDSPVLPLSLYSISKVAGEKFVEACARARGLDAVTVRPSNHTGPGQTPKFVAISFARQILEASDGNSGRSMQVGNLDSVRDFSDVRDVVRAYRLAMERGRSGAVYNISSGTVVTIGELLERMFAIAGTRLTPVRDEAIWRPTDKCAALDTSAIRRDTGWEPRIALEDTLRDIFAALRAAR